MTALKILLGAFAVWAMCQSAGELLFRAIRLRFAPLERLFLAFTTGTALISSLMFGLACCQIAYTKVIVIAGVLIVAAWIYVGRRDCLPRVDLGLSPVWQIAFWTPLVVYGILYLLTAMAPETDPDGPVYHVGLIARYYEHRGFFPVYSLFAGLGEGIEMLFWIAFSIGKHSAAAMVELLFLMAAPFGMLAFGGRVGNARAGALGGLLFYIAPVVGKAGTIPYIDVATAVVAFAVFYLLQIWRGNTNARVLALAGLLAGFCFACKITASAMVVYAVFVAFSVAWKRGGTSEGLRAAAIVTACACLTALPWIVKNLIYYGNPFWPLFNHWFPNPYQYEIVETELRRAMAHTNDVSYRDLPYELAMGGKLFGTIGPIFLVSPLALLSLRRPAGRQLLIAFLPMALSFLSNTGARFFIPALPFLSMALALAVFELPSWTLFPAGSILAMAAIVFHGYSSWPGIIERWTQRFQWRIEQVNLAADLRIIPENEYLAEHWRDFRAGRMLDRYVPAADLVFSPAMGQLAYHHRRIVGSFDSSFARRAWTTLLSPLAPPWSNRWRREIRFAPVTASKFRLQATAKFDNDLRISELHFFDGDAEIARSPQWRLTASRNPWEIQLAFDNDFWSWWTSGAAAEPGTWVEADLPAPVRVDRMVVEQIEDERWIQLRPLADIGGKWTPLTPRETGLVSPPDVNFRMELRDELKSMGIAWILATDESPEGTDLRTKSPQWGIERIAAVNGYSLYKLR